MCVEINDTNEGKFMIEGHCLSSVEDYSDDEMFYQDNYPEEWDDGSSIGCKDCPPDECTGHCMSCAYRPV